MAKSRSGRSKKRRFTGNRYTIRATINENDETSELNSTESASAKKLESSHTSLEIFSERLFETSKDNRIVSWTTLISFFAIVCCPDCYSQGLELIEDSVSGLCSHMNLKCKNCSFYKGFPTTEKMKGSCLINSSIVLGLRIIGKGFSAGKKLCAFLGLPFLSKLAFRNQERKLLKATERVAQENINAALSTIKGSNSFTKCGISIDGTWQRRGYSSLNGCCPEGSESWCRYQSSKAAGSPLKEIEQGLPNKIINLIKPTYLKLCNEILLKKCLHDQNNYYEPVDEARELALQSTIDYHIKNKIRYDARCIEKKFNPGDFVAHEEFQYPNTRKLRSPFSGPYEIIKQCSEVTYEINPPIGQNGFFRPTREASKMDCTDFSAVNHRCVVSDVVPVVVRAMRTGEIVMNPQSPQVSVGVKFIPEQLNPPPA
ncbi:CCHC-type domain-containing protein [Trichonephila clavipes]|uniref:CCHC-type domain-containing protein n=1 Tax=Trichonephila clavipes TaxID=2585209 RepID=A0A8X6UYY3_TRICX|nr:CCHC-type domain-containing protein [Trichonephila clavipes]